MNEHDSKPGNAPGNESATELESRIEEEKREMKDVTVFSVIISVFRAWFGVQTEENRKRDFNANNPTAFIIAGVIFTVIMVIGVIIAVNIALSSTGH